MLEAKLDEQSGNFHRPMSEQPIVSTYTFHSLEKFAAREVYASPDASHSFRPRARGVSVSRGSFCVSVSERSSSSARHGGGVAVGDGDVGGGGGQSAGGRLGGRGGGEQGQGSEREGGGGGEGVFGLHDAHDDDVRRSERAVPASVSTRTSCAAAVVNGGGVGVSS
jgi:hypothetical protein